MMRRALALFALLALIGPASADGLVYFGQSLGTAGGDLSGSYPNPSVAKINGAATPTSGLWKGNGTGGASAAISGTDYAPATSGSSILKGNGAGGFSNATSGTDYAPATSGTGLLKGNGTGGFATATKGTDYSAPGATMQGIGSNPTATGGTVMMGLGSSCQITPTVTGRVIVSFNFTHTNAGSTTDTAQIKYGTGTPPANNTAATGTNLGSQRPMYEPTATASNPVSISGLNLSGLTVGTTYWFDILLGAGSGSAAISGVDCSANEF